MKEEETIDEFHGRLKDISNRAFKYGKTLKESKLVKKMLRSLPRRFAMKVTAFTESNKDLSVITLSELVGSLRTYELENFSNQPKKQLAFKSMVEDLNLSEEHVEGEDEEVAMLARNLRSLLRRNEARRISQNQDSRNRNLVTPVARNQRTEVAVPQSGPSQQPE